MAGRLQKNLEVDFWRSIYRDAVAVPGFLLASYQELGLSDSDLIALIRIMACRDKHSEAISREELLHRWSGQERDLLQMLAFFEQRGFLAREVAANGVEVYTVEGLYEKLLELWVFRHSVPGPGSLTQPQPEEVIVNDRDAIRAVYAMFEGEFGRPLSPTEIEKLNFWLIAERWDVRMLKEALGRAVLHGAVSLAYIDKILLCWQREGISSPEQLAAAENAGQSRDSRPKTRQPKSSSRTGVSEGYSGATDYSKYF